MRKHLTGFFETRRKGGQIICRPHVVSGPVQVGRTSLRVPPELLARAISLDHDTEARPCR
jgi:hypothetical protein